jgi:hypothetical protein
VRRSAVEQAEDGRAQVEAHRPAELVADLLDWQLLRHQVPDAVGVLALDRNMQRVRPCDEADASQASSPPCRRAHARRTVQVRSVDIRIVVEQEDGELEVAAGQRVVERRAPTAMLRAREGAP